jgi:PAS domain S-box-containing protein
MMPGRIRPAYSCILGTLPVDDFGSSLIDGLEDAVIVTDTRLDILAWNTVMERLTAVPRAAAIGRPAAPLLSFLGDVPVAAHLERALRGEMSGTGDVRYEASASARAGWLRARYAPWHDAAGRVAGVLGFHVDVTERRRRATFVRAIEAIGQSLTSSLDLDEALDTIVDRALEVMNAESALVVSWDGKAPAFTVMRAAGRFSAEYSANGDIPLDGGPVSRAMLEGHAVFTPNILTDGETWLLPEQRERIAREGVRAVAAAPLRSKASVHGALVVHYSTERTFSDEDVVALRLLAEQAALAIDNARVYAEATRRAERLRELADLEQLVNESLVVDDVLRRIAHATARLLDAPIVQLWTADSASRVLRLQASYVEPGTAPVRMPRTVAFGEGVVGRVATDKAPIYVSDVARDPRALSSEWAQESGIHRMLSVPIVSGDDLLGVLAVRARTDTLAQEENRALVVSFAARAAVAMQNARTYAEAVRRATRLRDLVAVSRSITASLDASDVMQRIAGAAAGMTPGALAAVHVFDEERRLLRTTATSGAEWQGLPTERPAGAGLAGLVAEQHAPVLIPQPLRHARTLEPQWWVTRPKATYYGVPIDVGESFVGVLDYILPEGLPDAEEQEALRLLAAQAGVAIRNARLYQAERLQAERIRTLAAINQRMSGALELDDLLRSISVSAAQVSGVGFALFWLADDARQTLTVAGGSLPDVSEDFPRRTLRYDEGLSGWVARHRRPLAVDDVTAHPGMLATAWWQRWRFRSLAGYPVIAGDQLLAVLVFCSADPIRFSPDIADIIDMFIAQAAIAVQNARLFREAQRRRDVAEALARLGRELTGTLDPERIGELVARGMIDMLAVRGAAVCLHDADTGELRVLSAFGDDAPAVRGVALQPGEGVAGRAIAERKLFVTPDMLNEPRVEMSSALRERIKQHESRVAVGVPLLTHERIVGALTLADRLGREFTADELQALQAFADQAALAFENAQLYERARDSLNRLRETQAQLVQAAKMSALGQLVSGVAHELNNPLSVIIGYGQLLLGREMPDTVKRPVELMVSQGDRMAKIVRNLLYFARQRPPERSPVDINHVIEETLALRMNQLTLSGITVETDFAPNLPAITGDAQQLEQVVLNLLLNAEQAILEAKPGGRIVLRTRPRDDRAAITLEIVDDGPGIPAEALPRVFEPFFTTKVVGMGTGLGLSVSYGIIEEHGGRLSVQSHPGETTFTVELPVTASPGRDDGAAPVHRVYNGTGRVALVVEDEPAVVDLVVTLLGETGWRVDVAAGGRAGLDSLQRRNYDLIVSDMRMPEGDGEEFYRIVLDHDEALARRFIFITGDTANPDARAFLAGTDVPVLEKPFPRALFEDAVHRLMTSLTSIIGS